MTQADNVPSSIIEIERFDVWHFLLVFLWKFVICLLSYHLTHSHIEFFCLCFYKEKPPEQFAAIRLILSRLPVLTLISSKFLNCVCETGWNNLTALEDLFACILVSFIFFEDYWHVSYNKVIIINSTFYS